MSRHEGVSCDSCLKGNFRGRRYKCLICYDYDLCATCYEAGATTTRHTTDHPVQCILTRSDFDMYYGGEALAAEQPQSFTCPYCCKMGYTEANLHEHVTAEHTDVSVEIVCPVCASLPGGDPNHVTDDFASHLALEHHTPRDFDEPPGLRHVRRIPHPGRGGGPRTRRGNMHFGSSANTLTGLSPSGRENMDPIAELLSQLSSVRNRAAAAQSVSSQLQQLEMQLQSTRFLTLSARQQLERMPRRQAEASKAPMGNNANPPLANPESALANSQSSNNSESQYLLAKMSEENSGSGNSGSNESQRVERNMFVQELLLSTLTEQLQLATHADDPFLLLDSLKSPETETEKKPTPTSPSGLVSGEGSSIATVMAGAMSTATSGRDGAGGGRNVATEAQCKSKSGGTQATVTLPASKSSCSSTSPSSSAARSLSGSGSASPVGASVQLEARSITLGAAASGSGIASPPSGHNVLSSRPPLLAAAPPSPPNPQPQGSTVNLNEHAMSPPARQAAANVSPRDANRLNPAAAKRSMLKHLPASRGATDMDPPPH
ncbi:E3 ubiquitin-protein ligase KCMF1-like isoform X3 [Littorina saxatilis]|uniref:RING-type E3 ubiquitin transferase n=1 Tax=Littorina saxatilis TaxID=31220 RepID=A0AAN9BQ53_9CAEN